MKFVINYSPPMPYSFWAGLKTMKSVRAFNEPDKRSQCTCNANLCCKFAVSKVKLLLHKGRHYSALSAHGLRA